MITDLFTLVSDLSHQLKSCPSASDFNALRLELGTCPTEDGFRNIAIWDVISDLPSFGGARALEERLDKLNRDANQLAYAFRSTTTNNNRWLQDLQDNFQRCARRLDGLKGGAPSRPASSFTEAEWQAEASHLHGDLSALRLTINSLAAPDDLGARLLLVEDDVSDMKQRIVGTNTFTFRNNVFGSSNDVLKILTVETLKEVHVGFFLDMFTALCRKLHGREGFRRLRSSLSQACGNVSLRF
jgi:hypothetical protein